MRRVLIINECGLLSAMPTLQEFHELAFDVEGKIAGEVECSDGNAAIIFQERSRVRVLLPGSQGVIQESGWLYIAVVKGIVELVGIADWTQVTAPNPILKVRKRAKITNFFRSFFSCF